MRDARTGLDREIYRSEGHIPYAVTLSPDGRFVAFIEVVSRAGARKQRLTVIDTSARIVRLLGESSTYAVRGIREHMWCCGLNTLAIIVGGLSDEGGSGQSTTLPHGLSLVDVRTGTATPIEGLRFPMQIHWSASDSSLYIKDSPDAVPGARGPVAWPVYRYDVPARALSRTTRRGIFVSPDGKYYFDTGVSEAWGSFQLYTTADDQDITARLTVARHNLGPEGGWLPGTGHVLLFVEKAAPQPPRPPQRGERVIPAPGPPRPRVYPERWNLMVDAETGRIIERFQGDIGVGWKSNGTWLPVEHTGGVGFVRHQRP